MTAGDKPARLPCCNAEPHAAGRLDSAIKRRKVIRWALGGGTALAGAALVEAIARRGVAAEVHEDEALVGSWLAIVNPMEQPGAFKALVTFGADDRLVHSEDIAMAAPPPLHTTSGHGVLTNTTETRSRCGMWRS